ncbi:MAG: phytanoyl-CoA dioxygenase family protein [Planctomycetota bacterium]|nr:phytanoyl-CoA dioxygenase family protein [Planctomycetota bacterium]
MQEPIITADCDDEYLVDYMFDLHGYLILKNAIAPEDIKAINHWIDDHWAYVEGAAEKGPRESAGQWIGNVETHTYGGADGLNFQNIIESGEVFEKLIDYPAWIDRVRRFVNPVNGLSIHENFITIRGKGGYIGPHCGGRKGFCYMTFRQANTGDWMVGQINMLMALTDIGPGDGPTTLIPGSHKARFPHPVLANNSGGMVYRGDFAGGDAIGMKELYMEAGDVAMFTDTITHGSAKRENDGYRRNVVYRYSPRFIRSRFHYVPSVGLLERLTEERRQIIQPIPPRMPVPVD